MKKQQKGMSSIGLLFVIVTLVAIATIGAKLAPEYMEYYQLKTIFSGLAEEPDIRDTSPSKIKSMLGKRLQVNAIYDFNIEQDTFIGEDNGYLVLEFNYQKRKHIFANIDVVVTFDYSKEIE